MCYLVSMKTGNGSSNNNYHLFSSWLISGLYERRILKVLYILFNLSFNELSRYALLCLFYLAGNRTVCSKYKKVVDGRTAALVDYV